MTNEDPHCAKESTPENSINLPAPDFCFHIFFGGLAMFTMKKNINFCGSVMLNSSQIVRYAEVSTRSSKPTST